ncbi:MAG: DUF2239 family protein [Candidatus Sericytochromatia bacterium]
MAAAHDFNPHTYTAFADGERRVVTDASLEAVVASAREALAAGTAEHVVIVADASGRMTEVEAHAEAGAIAERLGLAPAPSPERQSGPGRPKLGVVSREVSLLPRHWEWLGAQSGGASAAIRRMVEEAIKRDGGGLTVRQARDAANAFMWRLATDQPHHEEVSRALYRGDDETLETLIADWAPDLAAHMRHLAGVARRVGQAAP